METQQEPTREPTRAVFAGLPDPRLPPGERTDPDEWCCPQCLAAWPPEIPRPDEDPDDPVAQRLCQLHRRPLLLRVGNQAYTLLNGEIRFLRLYHRGILN